ncbi:MAG: hypothetical protein ACE5JQ_05590 [Candidatus Methylomirabilales bacterium]
MDINVVPLDSLELRNQKQLRRNAHIVFLALLFGSLLLILAPIFDIPNAQLLLPLGILLLVWALTVPILKFRLDLLATLSVAALVMVGAYALKPLYLTWIGEGLIEVGSPRYKMPLVDDVTIRGTWYVILFSVALLLAYAFTGGNRGRQASWLPRNCQSQAVHSVAIVLIVIGLLGWAVVLVFTGIKLPTIFARPFEFRYFIFETPGLYHIRNFLMWSLWSGFWLPFLLSMLTDGRVRGGKKLWLCVYFIFLEVISVGLGQRWLIIMPIVYVVVIRNLVGRKIGLLAAVLLAALSAGISFSYILYRNLSWEGVTFGTLAQALSEIDIPVYSVLVEGMLMAINRFEFFPVVLAEFDGELLFGRTLLYVFVIAFPMSLFPGRPVFIDTFFTRSILYYGDEIEDYGIAWGVMPEWYINFHVPGIIIAGLIIGFILHLTKNFIEGNKRNLYGLLIYINGYINLFTLPYTLILLGFYTGGTVEVLFFFVLNVGLSMVLAMVSRGRIHSVSLGEKEGRLFISPKP